MSIRIEVGLLSSTKVRFALPLPRVDPLTKVPRPLPRPLRGAAGEEASMPKEVAYVWVRCKMDYQSTIFLRVAYFFWSFSMLEVSGLVSGGASSSFESTLEIF